jgi:hypothetical protein
MQQAQLEHRMEETLQGLMTAKHSKTAAAQVLDSTT